MERRDLLRALGAAAAFTLVPRDAQAAWETVAAVPHAPPRALIDERAVLVSSLADAIIPRTDSPGATDVGVTAFIDVIVAEYYADEERAVFLSGLDAIGALVKRSGAASFGELAPDAQKALLDSLDSPPSSSLPESVVKLADRVGVHTSVETRAWSRLKGLVIHGYFTSERVQKEVLKTEIMPGRFEGNAKMKSASGGTHG